MPSILLIVSLFLTISGVAAEEKTGVFWGFMEKRMMTMDEYKLIKATDFVTARAQIDKFRAENHIPISDAINMIYPAMAQPYHEHNFFVAKYSELSAAEMDQYRPLVLAQNFSGQYLEMTMKFEPVEKFSLTFLFGLLPWQTTRAFLLKEFKTDSEVTQFLKPYRVGTCLKARKFIAENVEDPIIQQDLLQFIAAFPAKDINLYSVWEVLYKNDPEQIPHSLGFDYSADCIVEPEE